MSLVNKGDTAEGASADRVEKADRVCKELAALAVKALLDEAALFPKPGLVDPVSQGAHSDMDFTTLVRSAAALQQGFYECARIGYKSAAPFSAGVRPCTSDSGISAAPAQPIAAAVRKRLRATGLALEKAMFAETHGVNTHKGAIFIFAYLLGAAGLLSGATQLDGIRSVMELTETLCAQVRVLAAGLCSEDMAGVSAKRTLTHGEQVFLQYGCTGIRGEAEAGLPLVQRNVAYLAGLTHLTQRDAYLYTLLHIIAENKDTNVLFRAGSTALRDLQTRCASIIKSGATGATLYAAVEALDVYCIERHISPGGSADIFAAVLFCRSLAGA
ncbi:triphosphoribosyl-dephospho-CoA synthase [Treponema vincentii ATCC 35580]|uniref:triphosphoribosyl-dephospho-CoA synthase n=1 Tax=Treponema vincentii ATCC 35580 TaxID=596324 RepID=C8PQL2_9SPIR|nr:triphosphoribosyl-dephospho-CoA synthase [Treponema vincentii]EEV20367.1 triphosphoribosyl-dephospho-CoA synthase [Treponema vincentii ATCC 35580]